MVSAWRNFKNIFSRPLFNIIFKPEMLKFHPYSILNGDTMVVFVIFCVLRRFTYLPPGLQKLSNYSIDIPNSYHQFSRNLFLYVECIPSKLLLTVRILF